MLRMAPPSKGLWASWGSHLSVKRYIVQAVLNLFVVFVVVVMALHVLSVGDTKKADTKMT